MSKLLYLTRLTEYEWIATAGASALRDPVVALRAEEAREQAERLHELELGPLLHELADGPQQLHLLLRPQAVGGERPPPKWLIPELFILRIS